MHWWVLTLLLLVSVANACYNQTDGAECVLYGPEVTNYFDVCYTGQCLNNQCVPKWFDGKKCSYVVITSFGEGPPHPVKIHGKCHWGDCKPNKHSTIVMIAVIVGPSLGILLFISCFVMAYYSQQYYYERRDAQMQGGPSEEEDMALV